MSSDRITALHEKASEHYLNGDYTSALASWRELLAIDPHNEEALEGVKMASQFSEEQPAPAAPPPDIEQDLDLGLKVFDTLGPKSQAQPAFELGDPAQVDSPPVLAPVEEEWEPRTQEEPSFGLAPASAISEDAAAPTAAAVELRRRVDDLLTQARAKHQAGDRDEALAILSRVSILDEENADAAALRSEVEASGQTDLHRIEQAIIEGVSALESARFDDAERLFQEALSLSPGHREALHYLEQVASRRAALEAPPAAAPEDLLGEADAPGDFSGAPASAEPAVIPVAKPRASRPLPPSMPEPQRPAGRGLRLPSLKVLAMAGIGGVVIVCALMAAPLIFDEESAPPAAAAVSRPPAPKASAVPQPAVPAAKPAPQGSERTAAVSRAVERGQRLAASGDYAGAVVAYNEAVRLDPANLDARAGLASAGAQYRAQKSDDDAMKAVETAFAGGEYASGLRLAYRLPGTFDPSRVEKIKTAGWYNLAIVALRAGDCRGAIGNLDELLGITAADAEATKLREFAERYAEVPKDRAFLDTVEALPFRPFP